MGSVVDPATYGPMHDIWSGQPRHMHSLTKRIKHAEEEKGTRRTIGTANDENRKENKRIERT